MTRLYIDIIGDYGPTSDLAFKEVKDALTAEVEATPPHTTHCALSSYGVPAFNTVATGFFLGQAASQNKLKERQIFYVNTAPRKDDFAARHHNAGEGLVYAQLENGNHVLAVNSGFSLSFIKEQAAAVFEVKIPNHGSQFRSARVFPKALGWLLSGTLSQHLGADVWAHIPPIPEGVVGYVDGYGNIKTTYTAANFPFSWGDGLRVQIGSTAVDLTYGEGIFAVADGGFVLAPGSSGWQKDEAGQTQCFLEISLRGGSAAAALGTPQSGSPVFITLAPACAAGA